MVVALQQSGFDLIRVGGLGQIVGGAQLHSGHRRGDVAISGQDDGPRVGPYRPQLAHHVEPVGGLEELAAGALLGLARVDLQRCGHVVREDRRHLDAALEAVRDLLCQYVFAGSSGLAGRSLAFASRWVWKSSIRLPVVRDQGHISEWYDITGAAVR